MLKIRSVADLTLIASHIIFAAILTVAVIPAPLSYNVTHTTPRIA